MLQKYENESGLNTILGLEQLDKKISQECLYHALRKLFITSARNDLSSDSYSQTWQWLLADKGSFTLEQMLDMRGQSSPVTRGFGQDRRFSPFLNSKEIMKTFNKY